MLRLTVERRLKGCKLQHSNQKQYPPPEFVAVIASDSNRTSNQLCPERVSKMPRDLFLLASFSDNNFQMPTLARSNTRTASPTSRAMT